LFYYVTLCFFTFSLLSPICSLFYGILNPHFTLRERPCISPSKES
jgi:hypothetical protein